MSNECKAKSCDGMGFIGTALAAWIGASAAFGSCGSCDLTDVVGKKVNTRVEQVQQKVIERIDRLEARERDYLVPNGTYNIGGQENRLVPVNPEK